MKGKNILAGLLGIALGAGAMTGFYGYQRDKQENALKKDIAFQVGEGDLLEHVMVPEGYAQQRFEESLEGTKLSFQGPLQVTVKELSARQYNDEISFRSLYAAALSTNTAEPQISVVALDASLPQQIIDEFIRVNTSLASLSSRGAGDGYVAAKILRKGDVYTAIINVPNGSQFVDYVIVGPISEQDKKDGVALEALAKNLQNFYGGEELMTVVLPCNR